MSLELKLSDEELLETSGLASSYKMQRAIADAATTKAVLTIRDLFYPILIHEKQHVLVAILDKLLEETIETAGIPKPEVTPL